MYSCIEQLNFFTEYLFFSKNKQKNLSGGGGGGGGGAGGGGESRLYIVISRVVVSAYSNAECLVVTSRFEN